MAYNKEYHQQRYLNNKEKMLAQAKAWAQANKEKRNAISKKWRDNNKEQFSDICKKFKETKPEKVLANNAKRRAARIQQTPKWADSKRIETLYAFAKFMEWMTMGIKYHVDHIIPLQGKTVCGLHTHENLQILRASDNIRKGNKFNG